MTKKEKKGKAICVECLYSEQGKYYSDDKACANQLTGWFCSKALPPTIFNYIEGTVSDQSYPIRALCKENNSNGNCGAFKKDDSYNICREKK
jgi:hypothetical protein